MTYGKLKAPPGNANTALSRDLCGMNLPIGVQQSPAAHDSLPPITSLRSALQYGSLQTPLRPNEKNAWLIRS